MGFNWDGCTRRIFFKKGRVELHLKIPLDEAEARKSPHGAYAELSTAVDRACEDASRAINECVAHNLALDESSHMAIVRAVAAANAKDAKMREAPFQREPWRAQ